MQHLSHTIKGKKAPQFTQTETVMTKNGGKQRGFGPLRRWPRQRWRQSVPPLWYQRSTGWWWAARPCCQECPIFLADLKASRPSCSQSNIRPLAKLGKTVKITDTSNQRKAKRETMPAVAIAFRENTKPFDKADSVFNKDTFP